MTPDWLPELPKVISYSVPAEMCVRPCDVCGVRGRLRIDEDMLHGTFRVVCRCSPEAQHGGWYRTRAAAILEWVNQREE